ncbi:63b34891-272f-4f1b-bfe2-068dbf4a073c [Thermothielavioides terrestris]|uniref:63b34891-272f-4f1b-bfe2-068dbf4a073c n=1 Tax=Thermothielavioides terrestris TaxID=2587410 RepID=A0A446BKL2_9PEZI|nr:63b34891-272f-4f1b-bfe2-068dbf4a073c [Thermothielavioides terrestris]
MRVAAFLVTLFAALVAAAPEMTLEKIRERDLCDCNEVRCIGPPCCDNGTC